MLPPASPARTMLMYSREKVPCWRSSAVDSAVPPRTASRTSAMVRRAVSSSGSSSRSVSARLSRAEQRRQLLGELHQSLPGEGLGLEQRAPREVATALARRPRLHRQVPLLLQPQHHLGIAPGLHLAIEHLAAGVEGFVAVQRHALRRPR